MHNKKRQQEATIDWLVTCVITPCTYLERLYDLQPRWYSSLDLRYDIPDSLKDIALSYARRKRVFDALARRDTLGTIDMNMVDLAMGVNDVQLLEEVKKGLNCIDTTGNGFNLLFMEIMMRRVVDMTDDATLRRLMEKFRNSTFGRGGTGPDKRLFAELREQMQHTPLKRAPAKGPERTV